VKKPFQRLSDRVFFIEGLWGDHLIKNIVGYTTLRDLIEKEGASCDLVLLTVKSYDTENMLKAFHATFARSKANTFPAKRVGNLEKISQISDPNWQWPEE